MKMKFFGNTNLFGFVLMMIGMILYMFTGFMPCSIILGIGMILFVSFFTEDVFCDYVIVDTSEVLIRKRHYVNFLAFTIISLICTLGRKKFLIVWKQEYFKVKPREEGEEKIVKLSRKEYIALRNEQRKIYSTQTLSKEFMKSSYSLKEIGYKRKKARLIVVIILALITLSMLLMPDMVTIIMTLCYEIIFVPMIILWVPEYIDARILNNAYKRALGI